MRFVIAFFVMMLVAAPVQARDGTGKYFSTGVRSCGEWLEAAKEDKWPRLVMGGWVGGYVTAANAYIPGKANWLEGSDVASAMLWIDKYCRENSETIIPVIGKGTVIKHVITSKRTSQGCLSAVINYNVISGHSGVSSQ